MVIGCPGSGKSTFSKALCASTGLRLYHLDNMYWNADQSAVSRPVFLRRLEAVLQQDAWILDGNYESTMEARLRRCDTVFFLDYAASVCLRGVRGRKGKQRSDLPWVEPIGEDDGEFIAFIENYRRVNRPRVLDLLGRYADKDLTIFHDRDEADRYISDLNRPRRNPGN